MIVLSSISLTEALARGHETWELAIPRWGFDTTSERNILYPTPPSVLPSVQGISIAPGSTIDRVNVAFSPRSTPPVVALGSPASPVPGFLGGAAIPRIGAGQGFTSFVTVSARAPWTGFLPGPISLFAAGIFANVGPEGNIQLLQTGLAEARYGATYDPSGAAPGAMFGPAMGSVWQDPVLRVLFHLSRPPVPVGARAPWQQSFANEVPAAAEIAARVWPISGRRRVRVTVRTASGAASVRARLTGLTPLVRETPFDSDIHLIEHQIAPAAGTTTIAADNEATFLAEEPQMEFLMLRWQAVAVDSAAAVHFDAVD